MCVLINTFETKRKGVNGVLNLKSALPKEAKSHHGEHG